MALTAQEERIGVGWMSHPTDQELRTWIADPVSSTGGKLRYVVLIPGQTVFIPSGVVHFVFRLTGQNRRTLGLGGHILQWSSLDVWMGVILGQFRFPTITRRDASNHTYVDVVVKLVSQR